MMRTAPLCSVRALLLAGVLALGCGGRSPEDQAYIAAIASVRAQKDTIFRTDAGPVPPAARSRFLGLRYFDADPRWVVVTSLERAAVPDTVRFVTSKRTFDTYLKAGRVRFDLQGKECVLSVFEPIEGGRLFLPFTDLTTGKETYGAGRYLDPVLAPGDRITLDFNLAYNPYCAYDASWVCPVPPPENHLEIAVRAGEKVGRDGH